MPWIYVWLSYGTTSVLLVIFFIFFLGINKKFNYSFYRLVQCDLTFNLLTYFSTWITRLCQVKETIPFMRYVFYNYHFIFHIAGCCAHFFYHLQSASVITLCVHRFTSARFRNANQFWSRHYLTVYFGILMYCTILAVPLYVSRYYTTFYYDETTGLFEYEPVEEFKAATFATLFFLESWTYFTLIIITGLLSILVLHKRFGNVDGNGTSRKIMVKMSRIAITNTCVYLTVIVWQILTNVLLPKLDFYTKNAMTMIVSDVLSLSMPYILLICDKNVRKAMIVKRTTSTSTSSSVFTQRSD